jgi:hypothetical protein
MTDHVRDGTLESRVLLEDDDTLIEHFLRGGEGGTLVVTFDPILYLWTRPPFGHEFLRKQQLDVVAVRKKREHFYQPLSREAFMAAVAPVTARYARVVSYGSSLGAYAALYFGRDEPWTVIASSPRNSTHPVFGARVWQQKAAWQHARFGPETTPLCQAVIIFDPRDPIDHRYIEGEVLPQFARAEVMRVPYSGHPSNQFLGDIGFIAPFVRAVLADGERPALQRRANRARSATYHQVLAQACLQHGHLAWAETLITRALALNPKGMLAHRTRGMVFLAQQRWDDALAALEPALAVDPNDPLTLSLMDKARRGPELQTPPAAATLLPLPDPPRTSLPRRALRWWWRRLRRLAPGSDPR